MKDRTPLSSYEKMGIAAMLPGMVHMLELMQAEIDRMRALLNEVRETPRSAYAERKARAGRIGANGGWPADPEARKAEAQRRMAVRKQKKQTSALSEERKKAWAALPEKARKKRLAAMLAGRRKKAAAVPVVKMGAAA